MSPFYFQLQELEMENSKLQGDLQKLRESIVMDEATGENSQIKELMGKSVFVSIPVRSPQFRTPNN